MTNPPAPRPFQVHLGGVVDLISRSIYSTPQVFLRELLQNGHDAVLARAEVESTRITGILLDPVGVSGPAFRCRDDGIGLTATEAADLLATVGRSSKRDLLDLPRSDRLGQFGIGLLACFMVADEIRVLSRSATGGAPAEWIGRADGTFTVRELPGADLPVGTVVELTPRPDHAELLGPAATVRLAERYGAYLPTPVRVTLPSGGAERITRDPVFAQPFDSPSPELLALGRELLGAEPMDAIPLHVPATGTRGTAFVLPYPPQPGAHQAHHMYLGGMLVSEHLGDLLPPWAFFVRCVVDSTGLHPTASRESLVDDDALEETRDALGAALRRWLVALGTRHPARLAEFLSVHHLALRAVLLHDDDLAAFLIPWLPVETSEGTTTFGELVRTHPRVRYADTVDEFRQLASIARRDRPIVNAGHTYDVEILHRLPEALPGVSVERVSVLDELDALDPPPLADRAEALALTVVTDAALADLECTAAVREFAPAEIPSLYVADPRVLRGLHRERAAEAASPMWARVLGRIDEAEAAMGGDEPRRLVLNWRNPVVRTLARVEDVVVTSRTVRILYVQALLAGHRPLRAIDRATLTQAMEDMVHLSLGVPTGPPEDET